MGALLYHPVFDGRGRTAARPKSILTQFPAVRQYVGRSG